MGRWGRGQEAGSERGPEVWSKVARLLDDEWRRTESERHEVEEREEELGMRVTVPRSFTMNGSVIA